AAAHIDETRRPGESAREYVMRMAREKAQAAAGEGSVALAADTIVLVGGEGLGKPRDRSDAERMLRILSGIEHRVITAVCVPPRARVVETAVKFAPLSEAQVRWLAASGDGDDKAGAYAVQGLAGAFVERIDGSITNVVGLPPPETLQLLEEAGPQRRGRSPRRAAGRAPGVGAGAVQAGEGRRARAARAAGSERRPRGAEGRRAAGGCAGAAGTGAGAAGARVRGIDVHSAGAARSAPILPPAPAAGNGLRPS